MPLRATLLGGFIAASCLLAALPANATATRTHVSNAGNDANAAFSCDAAHPCRTFAVALANTTAGGEILAVDSSGYGKLVIDRSVSVIAAPGVFAGIGVGAGGNATGVEIATGGVNVVLRGLTITGQGGTYGINMTSGVALSIENCTLSGFSSLLQAAVAVTAAARLRIVDSALGGNYYGVFLAGGAIASVTRARFFRNTYGLYAEAGPGLSATLAAIHDSSFAVGSFPIVAHAGTAGAAAEVSVSRCVIADAMSGITATAGAGIARVTVGETMVTGIAGTALTQFADGTGLAILETLGDNTVTGNLANTSGIVSPISLM